MSESHDTSPARPAEIDPVAAAKARRGRNIALALGLVAFIIIVYGVTLIRMGGYVVNRPL